MDSKIPFYKIHDEFGQEIQEDQIVYNNYPSIMCLIVDLCINK